MEPTAIIGMVLLAGLAFANGSNDVSKGIATLAGSGVTNYPKAILWGTIWTLLGGVLSVVISFAMVKTFNGILEHTPDVVQPSPRLAIAVMTGAMVWVLLASRTGLPVSTTHAIIGGLCGAGLAAMGWNGIQWNTLLHSVLVPLGFSPVIAMGGAFVLFPATQRLFGGMKERCICVSPSQNVRLAMDPSGSAAMISNATDITSSADAQECEGPQVVSLKIGPDTLHWITSGLTSLARSLNDAPKVAFLFLGFSFLGKGSVTDVTALAFGIVAVGMGVGSYLGGKRVTKALAEKVTRMDHHEGFTANLTTAVLVTAAAIHGFPVSTTHVSSSAIIGMGLRKGTGEVQWNTVWEMVAAWILTLPGAAFLSVACWYALGHALN